MWVRNSIAIWFLAIAVIATSHVLGNPLNGRHLRVLTVEYPITVTTIRNATGHVISANGMLPNMLEGMSRMLNFSYHYIPGSRIITFDDTPLGRGAASYILNDEADYALTAVVGLRYRYQMVDFPASYYYSPFGTLVPYPKEHVNLSASFKPLSYQVWVAVIVSLIIFPLFLRLISTCNPSNSERPKGRSHTSNNINDWARCYYFVLGNIVSQGQFWPSKRTTSRIAAGAWCCVGFFLVQIYCSTLISYLTTSNDQTIIDSFFNIPKTPGVILTLDRGLALDQTLKTTNSTFSNAVLNMLENDPSLRCNVTSDCLRKVLTGTTTIYAAPPTVLKQIMASDVETTGTCHYTALKETFWNNAAFTVLPKKSPYGEQLSRAILRTREAGLIDLWESWISPSIDKCSKTYQKQKRLQRLSLVHMSSAFVILGIGCILSLATFLLEKIRFFFSK